MATAKLGEEWKDDIFAALVDTTRTAGQISNEDLAYHLSSDPSLAPLLERQNSRLLQLVQSLAKSATSGTEITAPQLPDAESVDDNWKSLVDVFDSLLEKADACLDEYTGAVRRLSPNQEELIRAAATPTGKRRPERTYRPQNIAKPQLLFDNVPKNDELTPFKPLLRSKPHAIVPFEASLVLATSQDGSQQYKHPYEQEIAESQYPTNVHVKTSAIPFTPYENTTATLVDTPEMLMSMIEELKGAREIAVDLEHHDEHSYIGLVSLMQISTRDKDWIIDTLKPWRQNLQVLNEVFADPRILKVFHGAYMDMIWLQRDFGLYVVGLFDTYHASRSLGYPRNSLAYLLKRFADFDAAKQYQMADWRIRPLPDEMFNYARSDTHFLLYIYDNMRNELIEKSDTHVTDGDLIQVVMNHSKEESLQRYERPIYDMHRGFGAMGWYNLLYRAPALLNREQFAVFKAVHQWRDNVARLEDESVRTIMSKQVLYSIAREVPTDMPSLLGCSHPMSKYFQAKKGELLCVIKQAKAEGATGPEMKDLMGSAQITQVGNQKSSTRIEHGGPICAPAIQNSLSLDPPLMNTTSVFWGPLVSNQVILHDQAVCPRNSKLRLALPLPQVIAGHYQEAKSSGEASASIPPMHSEAPADIEQQYIKEEHTKQDVFILQQAGSSRKRSGSAMQGLRKPSAKIPVNGDLADVIDGSEDDNTPCTAVSEDLHIDLREQKRSTKARKREQGLDQIPVKRNEVDSSDNEEIEGFDYAKAPSVLHEQRNGQRSREVGGRPGENPYLKSMNAPKGLRKTKNEGGGNRSLIFRT